MKNRRPIGLLWLALLVGMLALAACGPGTTNSPQSPAAVPRISPGELKSKLDSGQDVLIVDTRSLAEYRQRHIPGAISVPYEEVASRLDELPRDREIVLYCT